MDCSLPVSSVHGIFQARMLEWVTISSSRGSFQPRDWAHVSFIAGRFFTPKPPGKPTFASLLLFYLLASIYLPDVNSFICLVYVHMLFELMYKIYRPEWWFIPRTQRDCNFIYLPDVCSYALWGYIQDIQTWMMVYSKDPKGTGGHVECPIQGVKEASQKTRIAAQDGWGTGQASCMCIWPQPHQGRWSEGYSRLIQNHLVFCLGLHCPRLVHLSCDEDRQEQMPCLESFPQKGSVAWQP